MRLGFVGTGALTAAIVAGLKAGADNAVSTLVSPRNEAISAGLASRFADVTVAADNQAVLDGSDMVMLAVRPQDAHAVLGGLRFRRDHHVVSLIATISLEEIAAMIAPAERLTKALPMPMAAYREGATIICPPDAAVAALFGRLGKAIEIENAAEFDALSVVTATFATHFTMLETMQAWLERQGVAEATGREYIVAIYKALAGAAERAPDESFVHLAREYATRGGVNEQLVRELTESGVFDLVTKSLGSVHKRIAGL